MTDEWIENLSQQELENIRTIEPVPAKGMQGLWRIAVDFQIGNKTIDAKILDFRNRLFYMYLVIL